MKLALVVTLSVLLYIQILANIVLKEELLFIQMLANIVLKEKCKSISDWPGSSVKLRQKRRARCVLNFLAESYFRGCLMKALVSLRRGVEPRIERSSLTEMDSACHIV